MTKNKITNDGSGRVIGKGFPLCTEAQVHTLFVHAQAVFAALKEVPSCSFEEPLSCTEKIITYRYFDFLPPSLSEQLRSRSCTEGSMRRIGEVLSALHHHMAPDGGSPLLHGDFVPHNVFCSADKLFIIDAHPPEQLPYRDGILYGDGRRDIISLLFGVFSNVGLKAVLFHGSYYCAMARSFLKGYQAAKPCLDSFERVLLSYIADVYKMRRSSIGRLRAVLHGSWCGVMVLRIVKEKTCKREN